jgi:hypothetical protein
MGIKFHCPNGHKLNVKAFLAGKKGVCPKCGTRLRIPDSSEPGLGDDDADDSDTGRTPAGSTYRGPMPAPAATAAAIAPKVAESQLPKPAPAPLNARPAAAPQAAPTVATPAPTVPMPAAMPGPVAAAAVPAAIRAPTPGDPIAEAPAAIWYVRPPSGGQFGPARGDVMRKWIAEGRVSSDSLVWREGWTDWQTAGKLFPNLQPASAPAATPSAAAAPVPTGITRAARTVSRYQAKKSGSGSMGVALLIFLAIACAGLIAVLVFVLFNMQT